LIRPNDFVSSLKQPAMSVGFQEYAYAIIISLSCRSAHAQPAAKAGQKGPAIPVFSKNSSFNMGRRTKGLFRDKRLNQDRDGFGQGPALCHP
jgi:hypothetical protein